MTQEEMLERLTEFDLQNPKQNQRGGVPLLVKGNKAYVDALLGQSGVQSYP